MNRFSCLTGIPESTKGLVREFRVRWMLEELGLPHAEVRYPHPEIKKEEYLKKQPFGQVPYFSDGDFTMFESGAILLHLALKYHKLLPTNEADRAHTLQWMFAALTSVEPLLLHSFLMKRDPDATDAMKARAKQLAVDKVRVLSDSLGERAYFGESFSIAEIIMTTVLRNARVGDLLDGFKNLLAYLERNESRPAFQRALSAHEKLY